MWYLPRLTLVARCILLWLLIGLLSPHVRINTLIVQQFNVPLLSSEAIVATTLLQMLLYSSIAPVSWVSWVRILLEFVQTSFSSSGIHDEYHRRLYITSIRNKIKELWLVLVSLTEVSEWRTSGYWGEERISISRCLIFHWLHFEIKIQFSAVSFLLLRVMQRKPSQIIH